MGVKGAKTIAEFAFRKFLESEGIDLDWFNLKVAGDEAVLTDGDLDTIKLKYDRKTHEVMFV